MRQKQLYALAARAAIAIGGVQRYEETLDLNTAVTPPAYGWLFDLPLRKGFYRRGAST